MKNKLKNTILAVAASAMCTFTGIGGLTTSADVLGDAPAADSFVQSGDIIQTYNHSYSWSSVHSVTTLSEGFSINTGRTITIIFSNCSSGAAVLKLYKYGNATEIHTILLPSTYVPDQSASIFLSGGSYYFTVVPQTGYYSTSGSVYVKNVDGVTQTS
jgi:hypothetical protein